MTVLNKASEFSGLLEINIHWGGLQFESKRLKECKNWVFIIFGP